MTEGSEIEELLITDAKNLTLPGNETFLITALSLEEDFDLQMNVTLIEIFYNDYAK